MKRTVYTVRRAILCGALVVVPMAVRADAAGEALLQQCLGAMGRARTLQADFVTTKKTNGQAEVIRGTLKLKRPNLAQIVMNGTGGTNNVTTLSDGRTLITYMRSDNEYLKEAADIGGGNVARGGLLEAMVFFNPDTLNQFRATGTGVKVTGSIAIGGAACRVLQITGSRKGSAYKIFVGPDHLLRGTSTAMSAGGQSMRFESRLTNVKANVALPAAAFAWNPPKGAKPYQPTTAGAGSGDSADEASSLLPVGRAAPDFTLPQYGGGKVSLAAVARSHRATLLNFWSLF